MRHLAQRIPAIDVDAFVGAFIDAPHFVLDGGGHAFLGAEPVAHLCDVTLDALREALRSFADVVFDAAYPFPFRAGLVGYFGYELGQKLERLPGRERPSLGLPTLAFALHEWVIAIDRQSGETWLSVVAKDPERVRDELLARLAAATPVDEHALLEPGPIRAWHTRNEYEAAVVAAKEHIFAGDVFEVCLTTAFDVALPRGASWPLFRALQRDNPAPFAAFLALPDADIVSSSPERFLSLDAHGHAETRPIKGTRPRGATPAEDARIRAELAASEKDRAENAMIVDLARNDLGRVCRFGSVVASELYAVESFATVHQLVSTVRGELLPDTDAFDLLRAAFPPGSMTGAPKIEAMTILEDLEPVERGPYAGALGWLDVGGAMDLSVVIRTAVFANGIARFAAGGAVVADSEPAAEYEEMLLKTHALRRALGLVDR